MIEWLTLIGGIIGLITIGCFLFFNISILNTGWSFLILVLIVSSLLFIVSGIALIRERNKGIKIRHKGQ
jgi:energy-converting hydrogenase Eha subunit H